MYRKWYRRQADLSKFVADTGDIPRVTRLTEADLVYGGRRWSREERREERRRKDRKEEEGRRKEQEGVSLNQVNYDKPHRPCIMTDIVPSWPAFHLWKLDKFQISHEEVQGPRPPLRVRCELNFPNSDSPIGIQNSVIFPEGLFFRDAGKTLSFVLVKF
jgi:hypothetical protein